jgi:hypothetical protein
MNYLCTNFTSNEQVSFSFFFRNFNDDFIVRTIRKCAMRNMHKNGAAVGRRTRQGIKRGNYLFDDYAHEYSVYYWLQVVEKGKTN